MYLTVRIQYFYTQLKITPYRSSRTSIYFSFISADKNDLLINCKAFVLFFFKRLYTPLICFGVSSSPSPSLSKCSLFNFFFFPSIVNANSSVSSGFTIVTFNKSYAGANTHPVSENIMEKFLRCISLFPVRKLNNTHSLKYNLSNKVLLEYSYNAFPIFSIEPLYLSKASVI